MNTATDARYQCIRCRRRFDTQFAHDRHLCHAEGICGMRPCPHGPPPEVVAYRIGSLRPKEGA